MAVSLYKIDTSRTFERQSIQAAKQVQCSGVPCWKTCWLARNGDFAPTCTSSKPRSRKSACRHHHKGGARKKMRGTNLLCINELPVPQNKDVLTVGMCYAVNAQPRHLSIITHHPRTTLTLFAQSYTLMIMIRIAALVALLVSAAPVTRAQDPSCVLIFCASVVSVDEVCDAAK